jgi:hypothetical protein
MSGLRLEVTDWAGPSRWRWVLSGPGGQFLADFEVDLDAPGGRDDPGWEGFTDLEWFLRWRAALDRRLEHEAELVAQVGDWITQRALGPAVAEQLVRRPGSVHLVIPPDAPREAQMLAYRPWQAARLHGRTLAASKVVFVTDPIGRPPAMKQPVGDRLRMLAVFSLPEDLTALNLRRERYALARLVHDIATVNDRAVELQVLQYGATGRRLEDALLEGDGWDILHLSGHGLPAGLVLEDDAGRKDVIDTGQLVDLIDAASARLKLITLSACESAALTAEDHLRLLGLGPAGPDQAQPTGRDQPEQVGADPVHQEADREAAAAVGSQRPPADAAEQEDDGSLSVLATALVDRVDVAVLAMRYPVVDDFAIGLAEQYYDLVLGKGQPVDRALGLALPRVIPARPIAGVPALSVATPALFGARAIGLELEAPAGQPTVFQAERVKLARFPDQPTRFVGRVGPMTRTATALAPRSGLAGVLFHGMAGAGKTACALELAYTHQDAFQLLVWHQAPQEQDITAAFSTLAQDLEAQIPGLKLVHLADTASKLQGFLPTLTQFLEQHRVLLVLDNLESLLTSSGAWRDERWRLLVEAVAVPNGQSRLILTSRTRPAALPDRLRVEPVHALSLQESVLLAREWPHLRALLDTPSRGADDQRSGQGLAARVLAVVQGHPKLIELADGQAADPAALAARLDEADQTWLTRGIRLQDFLNTGEPQARDTDYYQVLDTWTRATTAHLPPAANLLFTVLAGLEDDDRIPFVLDRLWPQLWAELGQPDPARPLDTTLTPLVEQALVAVDADPDTGEPVRYRIHPGIAESARTYVPPDVTQTIDTAASQFWQVGLDAGLQGEAEGTGWLVLRAGRAAAPYLARQREWMTLRDVLGEVLIRDDSPTTAATVLPYLQAAAEATTGTDQEVSIGFTHARALASLRRGEATTLLRRLLNSAHDRGDHRMASIIASELINFYQDAGRYQDALSLTDQMGEDVRAAGDGPWTQLTAESSRLMILRSIGNSQQVLDEVEELRNRMATLPDPSDQPESIKPFNVREFIVGLGRDVARDLEKWQQSLDLNAELILSKRTRGAPDREVALARFNDYGPLRARGRLGEARVLLLECREVFGAEHDSRLVAKTMSALADIEDELGHGQAALDLEHDALRLKYAAGDPDSIVTSHVNIAIYLEKYGSNSDRHSQIWAHRLAAAVIVYQTDSGALRGRVSSIARLLRHSDAAPPPASFYQVCAVVDQIDGVDLVALIDQLPRRAADGEAAMNEVLTVARQMPADGALDADRHLQEWEPVISALVAATTHLAGEPDASDAEQVRQVAGDFLDQSLDDVADSEDWALLVAALRRVHAGERDPAMLTHDLDQIDSAIVTRALAALDGSNPIDPMLWATHSGGGSDESGDETGDRGVEQFVAAVVAAAHGDSNAVATVSPVLDEMDTDPDYRPLAGALRAIIAGERNPTIGQGLGEDGQALIRLVLATLNADSPATDYSGPIDSGDRPAADDREENADDQPTH